ncbi:MAG: cation-transporting P-type ATPase [Deltaproteobacteria bacterium]
MSRSIKYIKFKISRSKFLNKLETSGYGLTATEAKERLQKFGLNKLAEAEKVSRLKILLHQFKNPLIYILLIAAVVTFFLQEYKETGVIGAVLLLNAIIGFIQEYKAEKQVRVGKGVHTLKAGDLIYRTSDIPASGATQAPPGPGCCGSR